MNNRAVHKVFSDHGITECGRESHNVENYIVYEEFSRDDPRKFLEMRDDHEVLCDECWDTYNIVQSL